MPASNGLECMMNETTREEIDENIEWRTERSLELCEIKEKLHHRWYKNKRNHVFKYEYKAFNNKINTIITFAKYEYHRNEFKRSFNNPKQTWKLVNEILRKKN